MSPALAPGVVSSQLIPMMGTATRTQATVDEHPSVALVSSVQITNLARPVPSAFVTPNVVLSGTPLLFVPDETSCSGARVPEGPQTYWLYTVWPSDEASGTVIAAAPKLSSGQPVGKGLGLLTNCARWSVV